MSCTKQLHDFQSKWKLHAVFGGENLFDVMKKVSATMFKSSRPYVSRRIAILEKPCFNPVAKYLVKVNSKGTVTISMDVLKMSFLLTLSRYFFHGNVNIIISNMLYFTLLCCLCCEFQPHFTYILLSCVWFLTYFGKIFQVILL